MLIIPSKAACTLLFSVWFLVEPGPDAAEGGFVRLIMVYGPVGSGLAVERC